MYVYGKIEGPSIDPWGTPSLISLHVLNSLSMRTRYCLLLGNYESILVENYQGMKFDSQEFKIYTIKSLREFNACIILRHIYVIKNDKVGNYRGHRAEIDEVANENNKSSWNVTKIRLSKLARSVNVRKTALLRLKRLIINQHLNKSRQCLHRHL